MRVLLTRPIDQSKVSAEKLRRLGHDPVIVPALEIELMRPDLPTNGLYSGIIVTSARALQALPATFPGFLLNLPIYCVGETTALAAERLRFQHVITGAGTAESLAEAIVKKHPLLSKPLWYLAGRDRSFDIDAPLASRGYTVETTEVYKAEAPAQFGPELSAAFATAHPGAILVYSHRSCVILINALKVTGLLGVAKRIPIVALSAKVAAPAETAQFERILIADRPSETELFAKLNQLETLQ